MKNTFRFLAALFAFALVATACGGGDSASGADQEYIDAAAASLRAEGDMPEGVDIECMAEAMVNGLGGAEGLESDYGITLEMVQNDSDFGSDLELSRDVATSLTSEMWKCDLQEAMVAEMAADMDEDAARCLVSELDQGMLQDMMAVELMNPVDAAVVEAEAEAELLNSMFAAIAECDIPLSDLGG